MKFILFSLALILAAPSHAEIIIEQITGFSKTKNFFPGRSNPDLQIFGGAGGTETAGGCANPSITSTCNNCDAVGNPYEICNETRIHDTLQLSFRYQSTDKFGAAKATIKNGTTEFNISLAVTPTTPSAAGVTVNLSMTWDSILNAIVASGETISSRCTTLPCVKEMLLYLGDDSLAIDLIIYGPPNSSAERFIDTTASTPDSCSGGLCNYSLFPGDNKASVENTVIVNGPGRSIANVIFICIEEADAVSSPQYANIPSYAADLKKIPIINGKLSKSTISGFVNDKSYSCRSASEDDTGNILYYVNPASSPAQDTICPTGTPFPGSPLGCHQVTPNEVIGLFREKQNCFIATAAYGSPWMKQVETLRSFRGKYLQSNKIGRAFVRWYYRNAPPVAQWISESPNRRFVARTLLTPLFATSFVLVNWPMLAWSLLFSLSALIIFRRLRRTGIR